MTSNTASTIRPQDFCQYTNDIFYTRWSREAMECTVDALDGERILAITIDQRTGHTVTDVTLTGLRNTPGYGSFQVRIEYEYAPGESKRTWYPLDSLGVIIAYDRPGLRNAKWDATALYRDRGYMGSDMRRAADRRERQDRRAAAH